MIRCSQQYFGGSMVVAVDAKIMVELVIEMV
jgi:hypothetical protein